MRQENFRQCVIKKSPPMNPLKKLPKSGQSVWLDYFRRNLIAGGEFKRLIQEDGIRGLTIDPALLGTFLAGSTDYDEGLRTGFESGREAGKLFESLIFEDVRAAATALRPVYERSQGTDGYVCLGVSPQLSYDIGGLIGEAQQLWHAIKRPNLMIGVPAGPAWSLTIDVLLTQGINVFAMLLHSPAHFESVVAAYLQGIKRCENPQGVLGAASFVISRVDTAVDRALDAEGSAEASALRGKAAIANAKAVYARYREVFYGDSFAALRKKGAKPLRLIWTYTGTKNPLYPDTRYVEELIGPDTVTALSPATLDAFRDHGRVIDDAIRNHLPESEATLARLKALGIDIENIGEHLQAETVMNSSGSLNRLPAMLEAKQAVLMPGGEAPSAPNLGKLQVRVDKRLGTWEKQNFSREFWRKPPKLWSRKKVGEISDRLGWLHLPEIMTGQIEDLTAFAEKIREEGITHLVLLGMGGSSLAPEVFQKAFGNAYRYPELIVLDSTHPGAVRAVENRINLTQTLFLASSKSGTTLETLSFFRYFWRRLGEQNESPGRHFVAITDPGSSLEKLAAERKFRAVFRAPSDVGGRYSALSVFGLAPAALIGADIRKLLRQALVMAEACAFCVPAGENPGLRLGALLGESALAGRNKLTFLASPRLAAFPAWIEQLIAESTGKDGKGILPVADEPPGTPEFYQPDRLFVHLRLKEEADPVHERHLQDLEAAGHPVARYALSELTDLGGEFFRWEMAVAAAGAILRIHPFDQPDVQVAKDLARKAMSPAKDPDKKKQNPAPSLSVAQPKEMEAGIRKWIKSARKRDYLSVQAYLAPSPDTESILQEIRAALGRRLQVATTLGYGPRFLHSTGQLHKGGPPTGLFLQLIDSPQEDLAVPETDYTFGRLIRAQADGDFLALKRCKRRVIRIDLGANWMEGISRLAEALLS